MRREAALRILREARPVLHDRYGVVGARLFGSLARADNDDASDVDVAVRFADGAPIDVMALCGVSGFLSGLFGADVDIVAEPIADSKLKDAVQREGVVAF